jgi:hypothetical protein
MGVFDRIFHFRLGCVLGSQRGPQQATMMAMEPACVAANSSKTAAADQQPPSLILLQNEQIDRLKEELAEKNETIFDLQISLATADAETQHRIAQVERETSLSVRRLEEELRRLQHEANRASSNNKRKMIITAETTVTPPPAVNNKNRSSSSSAVIGTSTMPQLVLPTAIETSAGAGATTTPLPVNTVAYKVQAAARRQDNALLGMHDARTTSTPRISSAQRLLLHLVSASSSSTTTMLLPHHHATALLWQRLWLAQTDVQIAKILIDEYIVFAGHHHHAGGANHNNNTSSTTAILQLLHQVLRVSPAACRYLVGGGRGKQQQKPKQQLSHTSCQLRIGSSGDKIVLSRHDHDHDLLNPLWTPTNTTATTTTTVVTREAMDDDATSDDDNNDDNDDPSSPNNFINALWQTVVQYPTTIPAWDILRLLLRYHRLPWRDEQQQTLVLRRLVAAGRSIGSGGVTSSTPRRQGSDDDNNDATTVMDSEAMDTTEADNEDKRGRCCETTESSASSPTTLTTTTTPIAVWLPAAVRVVTEYVRRVDCWQSLRSKPWATWLAVVLDLIEQQRPSPQSPQPQQPPQQPPDDDHSCQFACLQFLTVLVAQHHVRALDTFLRVEIVTDASTGELWHRAPSAVAVICQRLTRSVAVDTTVTEEAYLLPSEPSDMVLELIRFVYYTVIAVQEGRRQEQSVALWDVCHPFAESLAGTSALLLERTQEPHTTHMLQVILDELEEDYNERYAKSIKDDRQPP